ncbi:MAG: leucine-rich repeat protein, partial [Clostridia bacterium]|nr:leucine-rich repeat protein [Clostridia bacterium]
MLGHEIGVNAAAEAQSAPVMMAADTEVTNVSDESAFTFDASTGTITGFTAPSGSYTVTIPSTIDGVSVTAIGDNAFQNSTMTAVVVPDSVTSIGSYAYANCSYV